MMMKNWPKYFIGPIGSGKTQHLTKYILENGGILVTHDKKMYSALRKDQLMTFAELLNGGYKGLPKDTKIYIDNIENFMELIMPGYFAGGVVTTNLCLETTQWFESK